MHMADALLSPTVGTTFWAATLGMLGCASKRIKERIDDRIIPLMGVVGAFIFAAQMINFTIPLTGSSGHLGGGLILSIVFGPHAAFVVMASVLTVQSLFFADGGILALGCNVWNLGFYPAYIAYPLIYRPLASGSPAAGRMTLAAILSAVVGLQMGAFSVVLQTLLSGRSELPFGTFVLLMQPIHLAIGIVEGVITAGIVNFIRQARPEILDAAPGLQPVPPGLSLKKILVTFASLAIVTGGAMSWFASTHPDGLEWSIEKVYGQPELPEAEHGLAVALKSVQEKTAFLPDYTFKTPDTGKPPSEKNDKRAEPEPSWPSIEAGTSVAGLVGSLIVLGLTMIIGSVLRRSRDKKT